MAWFRRSLMQLEYSGDFRRLNRKRTGYSIFALPSYCGLETRVGIHQYPPGEATFQVDSASVFFSRSGWEFFHDFPHSVPFNICLTNTGSLTAGLIPT